MIYQKSNQQIFLKKLLVDKKVKENIFRNQLEWVLLPDSKMSRIKFEDTNLNLYNEDDWEQIDEFFIEHLPKLKEAFENYIVSL